MKALFYPGCSMQKNARPYLDSLLAIRADIDLELQEIDDWNCCGATEYMSVHRVAAHSLIGRNLALAQQQASDSDVLTAGCSACYLNLAKTDAQMREDAHLNATVNEALAAGGLAYQPGSLKVRHLLDVVCHDIGYAAIKARVVKPLHGLKVAAYYGCQVARPDYDGRWDCHEHPTAMDQLLRALGAEPVEWSLKTQCCGGHMSVIGPEVAFGLIRRLIHGATQAGADLVATLCPMCQLNLDAYQVEMNKHFHSDYQMPVLYFTQLMGLAFGKNAGELGIGKEFVDAAPALAKIQAEAPKVAEAKRKRRPKPSDGLPPPRME
ncbi:MAG: CoB--CoM heterodisulfide reductase iron-sulfur subunit B family protein [Gallionellaceae bacterium]|nr:CoB--CoM heterodisulfide reductase iron-sulfur subunit B family protein [Gallionellaceae bacterium]